MVNLVIIAKAPIPGRSKTRLCPPCTPLEAARIAEAALADTIAVVMATPGVRPILALDGEPGSWLPPALEVIPQRGDGLDERLASAFDDVGGPALLVGMDTPQLTSATLTDATVRLFAPGIEAVLGPAVDGGWWGIGLRTPNAHVFHGLPMSSVGTLDAQRARLAQLELSVAELATMRDVDRFDDAMDVAKLIPGSRFAQAVASVGRRVYGVSA